MSTDCHGQDRNPTRRLLGLLLVLALAAFGCTIEQASTSPESQSAAEGAGEDSLEAEVEGVVAGLAAPEAPEALAHVVEEPVVRELGLSSSLPRQTEEGITIDTDSLETLALEGQPAFQILTVTANNSNTEVVSGVVFDPIFGVDGWSLDDSLFLLTAFVSPDVAELRIENATSGAVDTSTPDDLGRVFGAVFVESITSGDDLRITVHDVAGATIRSCTFDNGVLCD